MTIDGIFRDPLPRVERNPPRAWGVWCRVRVCLRVMVKRIGQARRRRPRRLRLCESLALGERRFVAVVEFDHARFLVGGTAASLVLLARLEDVEGTVPKTNSFFGVIPKAAAQEASH
jgi:flagellar biogenesis protein FliO